MKKKISIIIFLLIFIGIYLFLSYYGIGFCHAGFNEIDILIFNVFGDAILVGITTYIATRKISIEIAKKEFNRNNKINITVNKIKNQIKDYKQFKKNYIDDDFIFNLNDRDNKVLDNVYNQYVQWEYVTENLEEDREKDLILNYPFNYFWLFNKNKEFNEGWKFLRDAFQSENIKTLYDMLEESRIDEFMYFSNILSKCKYYEIINLNHNCSAGIIITADNRVCSKIFLLPATKKKVMFYFEKDCNIELIAFRNDFEGKEEAVNIMGFRYSNDEQFAPAKINLSDYIKIVEN